VVQGEGLSRAIEHSACEPDARAIDENVQCFEMFKSSVNSASDLSFVRYIRSYEDGSLAKFLGNNFPIGTRQVHYDRLCTGPHEFPRRR
jgi:hypothetical protein